MPIIQHKTREDGMQWAIWQIDEGLEELIQCSRNPLSRSMELNAIASPKRKLEYLTTRLILEYLLNEEVKVDYHSTGKPFIPLHSLEISLSHTKGYAAAVVHPTRKVGIDIEAISSRVLNIQSRFLAQKELDFIDKEREIEHLLLLWSAKESAYKAIGEEGVDFKEEMLVSPFKPLTSGTFTLQEHRTSQRSSFSLYYQTAQDFVFTVTI